MAKKKPDQKTLLGWYEINFKGRLIDDEAPNYLKRAIGWSYHAPCAGHDGIQIAAGVCFRQNKDFLFPYYRDLLLSLAAGLSVEEIFLNGMSKASDVASGGRHMSNHFAKPEIGIQNVSSLVANHIQQAAGLGRAVKKYKGDELVYCSMGESSVAEGYVYEALNGISREKLPVITIMQDNDYGISVPKADQGANEQLAENFRGLPNLEIIYCDGTDVVASYEAMQKAIAYASSGKGGAIVYAKCLRIGPHSNSDNHELYRSEEELKKAKDGDPLPHFRKALIEKHGASEAELKKLEEKWKKEVKEVEEQAQKAPDPDPNSIFEYVLPKAYDVPSKYEKGIASPSEKDDECTLREGINKALHLSFEENENTFMWGQDMANKKKEGIFLVSKGMQARYGGERVFNAPIAEDFIVGTANGFSRYRNDIRVVVEGAEFADYIWPAMEQIVECSHDYWRSNGQFSPNVVIRLASGGYIGGGLYHSQNLEGTFSTLPGIRIVMPAFGDDAYGLFRTAIKSEGPTLFLEPKHLYNHPRTRCRVPEDFMVPFGKARIRREGSDMSILTYGTTVHYCLEVAKKLEEEKDANIEVVDLRSLVPLDKETLFESVRKTNKCLIVHEDKVFGGFGGELAALVSDECFESLDGPIQRVGSTFTPVGFNRKLERAVLPDVNRVQEAAIKLLDY